MSHHLPIQPEQGSYLQFQIDPRFITRPPTLKRDKVLKKLRDRIPQDENQWQEKRELHRFSAADDVLEKTKKLLNYVVTNQDTRRFLCLATCRVDWHLKQRAKAYARFKTEMNSSVSELTIMAYMKSIRGVLQSMDSLYRRRLRHRAFEAVLLYAPIGTSHINIYEQNPEDFLSCFPTWTRVEPEIQASLALHPAFLIKYRHPEHRYDDICEALGITVLDEGEFTKFVSVLQSGKPIPYALPLPGQLQFQDSSMASSSDQGRYDPVRDSSFGASQMSQKKAEEDGRDQDVAIPLGPN
ncbi:hypothetical protein F53441_7200 [Fusarium austroafricanum]|uniref:Uncharacterized protein n=1 Tax=Fusarium austroafricanum TaxID=2364996 RepID=A0A8H4KG78_9HYPO|nr:hypothetical protein F53441_7200 [Fusarium austroafricanum]